MSANAEYAMGLGRAFTGAVLFGLPLFMTMEMWWFGFAIHPLHLAALLIVSFPMLVALSYFAGFERTFGLLDNVLDAFAAFAMATLAAAIVLALIGVLAPGQPLTEIVGKIAVAAFPASIGALLADKQLNSPDGESVGREGRSYTARLFLMTIGALFVALNLAPTEEMILIAFQIGPWQAVALAVATLAVLHALLFWVDLPGRHARRGANGFWSVLVRFSFAGYGVCALASFALLWVFGRVDGVSPPEIIEFVIVLSFPAAIGAGLANIVVGEQRA